MSNFEVFPPKVKFYFSTLLKGKMFLISKKGKNYQKGVSLSTRNRVKELAQDYAFSKAGRRLGCSLKNREEAQLDWKHAVPKMSNHVPTVPKCTF